MERYPLFLSVVMVIRNKSDHIDEVLTEVNECVSSLVRDYELIVVDNASSDDTVRHLKKLTEEDGLPNLQVYALTNEVDVDTATWAGLENALGDYYVAIDPFLEDIHFIAQMMDKAVSGTDIVFANNLKRPKESLRYRSAYGIFSLLFKYFIGVSFSTDIPRYRIVSKRVINYILQYRQPSLVYRHLQTARGFSHVNLNYSAVPRASHVKHLGDSFDRGMRLLLSTTRAPMRLVTTLCLFGAFANILYSAYVVGVALLKEDVEPGWVSLSLQQSGMFFLLSLVLLVLGEYILNVVSLSNEGPLYHIGQEFTSVRLTHREKLNVEEVASSARHG